MPEPIREADEPRVPSAGAEPLAQPSYERVRLLVGREDELVWLVWRHGVPSAVHDHGGARGLVMLVAGSLRERLYVASESGLEMRSERTHHAPALVPVAARTLHTMESVGRVRARSLHVYRGATQWMHVYDPSRGELVPVVDGTGAHLPVDPTRIARGTR